MKVLAINSSARIGGEGKTEFILDFLIKGDLDLLKKQVNFLVNKFVKKLKNCRSGIPRPRTSMVESSLYYRISQGTPAGPGTAGRDAVCRCRGYPGVVYQMVGDQVCSA
jgi:hypothetical protein